MEWMPSPMSNFSQWRVKVKDWLGRVQPSESVLLGGTALVVGLASGAAVWAFKKAIDLIHQLIFVDLSVILVPYGGWTVVILPVLGGLMVGGIIHFFIGEERYHGVAGIMEAVALAGGRLRYKRMPAKAIASAVSIGSGASVGPEDPSVQIGSNLGSMLGQWFHFSEDRTRALVAAGAASGIAAAFNAPIAGVFFALEIILGEISGSALGVVVISAVISAVFTQAVSGLEPAFHVPAYAFNSAWELPLYLVLGLLTGPVAALYTRMLYIMHDIFHDRVHLPRWMKPLLAGLIVGLVGVFLPQIFGVGYETIESILLGESMGVSLLLVLMIVKLVLTPVSIAGGFLGGVFAPSLFIGATLGGAFGKVASLVFPGMQIAPPAFAMVGMAAVLAGAVHAPLTAVILLFEMTHDYRIILPLMFSVVVSMLVSQRLEHDSVYNLGLARKGIRLERGRDVELLETITVSEVMQPAPFTLLETDKLTKASKLFLHTHHHGVPVVNDRDELVGIFTIQDLDRNETERWSTLSIGDVCTRNLIFTYPDETIGLALRRMGAQDVGRLPVVERNNPRHLVGLLRRADLARAYDAALTRRAAMRHRVHQVRLDASTPEVVSVIELVIESNTLCEGKQIKEIPWPRGCIIASLRRGSEVLIPHGDTQLNAGDVLAVVAEGNARILLTELGKAEKPINTDKPL
jgi:CIC family chloride channel protein